ncbi:MAG: nuclear transport factor 2 family protein [Acidiferrobacterales bacterium]
MSDAADITKTLDLYFDALYEGDIWKLKQAFHPNAHLYSATGDKFVDLSLEEYMRLVGGRPSPQSQSQERTGRVVLIDQSGPNSAVVKVQASVKPRDFVDYLTLLRLDGYWKIISKTYHFTETA